MKRRLITRALAAVAAAAIPLGAAALVAAPQASATSAKVCVTDHARGNSVYCSQIVGKGLSGYVQFWITNNSNSKLSIYYGVEGPSYGNPAAAPIIWHYFMSQLPPHTTAAPSTATLALTAGSGSSNYYGRFGGGSWAGSVFSGPMVVHP